MALEMLVMINSYYAWTIYLHVYTVYILTGHMSTNMHMKQIVKIWMCFQPILVYFGALPTTNRAMCTVKCVLNLM